MSATWRPLRGETWERRAVTALGDLATAVAGAEPAGPGLAAGAEGMALFLAYYAEAEGDERAEARAAELLERACAARGETSPGPDLFAGLTGTAWAVEHLAPADDDEDDPNERVDERLAALLDSPAWSGPYDLVSGLCGIGVYALERLPSASAATCLERVVTHLERRSEPADVGRTWHTPPEHLPPAQRAMEPDGYYNLGMAHGVPGVVGLLSRAALAGVAKTRALSLLEDAVSWLLSRKLAGADAVYGPWWSASAPAEPTRTAWCYGDLGVASAVWAAARATGERCWEREAIELAVLAARRPEARSGVQDAGLCHGAFGLAHQFLRLYHATGEDELARAASAWIDRGLAMRQPGHGVAGFLRTRPDGAAAPDPGFLEGAAGIGLALLSALTELDPAWDALLLTDVAPCELAASRAAPRW